MLPNQKQCARLGWNSVNIFLLFERRTKATLTLGLGLGTFSLKENQNSLFEGLSKARALLWFSLTFPKRATVSLDLIVQVLLDDPNGRYPVL